MVIFVFSVCSRKQSYQSTILSSSSLTNLGSLIKDPTYYKNPEKPSCIDLLLTNRPKSFQNSSVVETALSDIHKMTVKVKKTIFEKLKPRVSYFRNRNEFCNETFGTQLLTKLSLENFNNSSNGISKSLEILMTYLHPARKKYLRETIYHSFEKNLKRLLWKFK